MPSETPRSKFAKKLAGISMCDEPVVREVPDNIPEIDETKVIAIPPVDALRYECQGDDVIAQLLEMQHVAYVAASTIDQYINAATQHYNNAIEVIAKEEDLAGYCAILQMKIEMVNSIRAILSPETRSIMGVASIKDLAVRIRHNYTKLLQSAKATHHYLQLRHNHLSASYDPNIDGIVSSLNQSAGQVRFDLSIAIPSLVDLFKQAFSDKHRLPSLIKRYLTELDDLENYKRDEQELNFAVIESYHDYLNSLADSIFKSIRSGDLLESFQRHSSRCQRYLSLRELVETYKAIDDSENEKLTDLGYSKYQLHIAKLARLKAKDDFKPIIEIIDYLERIQKLLKKSDDLHDEIDRLAEQRHSDLPEVSANLYATNKFMQHCTKRMEGLRRLEKVLTDHLVSEKSDDSESLSLSTLEISERLTGGADASPVTVYADSPATVSAGSSSDGDLPVPRGLVITPADVVLEKPVAQKGKAGLMARLLGRFGGGCFTKKREKPTTDTMHHAGGEFVELGDHRSGPVSS